MSEKKKKEQKNVQKSRSSVRLRPRTKRQKPRRGYGSKELYTTAPTSISKGLRNSNSSTVRFKRREFVCNVGPNGSGSHGRMFRTIDNSNGIIKSIANIALNAGLGKAFPWLSTVADAFDQFAVHAINFEYQPSCSTTTQGTVALSPVYDSASPVNDLNKTEILQRVDTTRSALWSPQKCQLNKKKLQAFAKSHFIRHGPLNGNLDIKTYDPGRLDVYHESASSNGEDTGELWVTYDIELQNPKNVGNAVLFPSTIYYWPAAYLQAAGKPALMSGSLPLDGVSWVSSYLDEGPAWLFTNPSSYYLMTVSFQTASSAGTCAWSVLDTTHMGEWNSIVAIQAWPVNNNVYTGNRIMLVKTTTDASSIEPNYFHLGGWITGSVSVAYELEFIILQIPETTFTALRAYMGFLDKQNLSTNGKALESGCPSDPRSSSPFHLGRPVQ